MAEAVVVAIGDFLFMEGVSLVAADAIAATIVSTAVSIGTNLAISSIVGAITAPEMPDLAQESRSRKQTVRSPVEPRRVIWGQTRVGGPMLYARITGASNEYLHMVIGLHHGEVAEIGDVYIGDKLSTDARFSTAGLLGQVQQTDCVLSGTYSAGETIGIEVQGTTYTTSAQGSLANTVGKLVADFNESPPPAGMFDALVTASVVTDTTLRLTSFSANTAFAVDTTAGPSMRWTVTTGSVEPGGGSGSFVRVSKHLGAADQTADTDLVSECAPDWTTDHRLRGIAYLYVRMQHNIDAFPTGIQAPSAIVKGRKVYDPRTGLTAWSDNFALCVLDYLIGTVETATGAEPIGIGATLDEIDISSFIAQANISDELVETAGGGTVKRYTCNGAFTLDASPADIVEQMLPAGGATLAYTGGKYRLHVGAYTEPDLIITADWLRGPVQLQPFQSRRELVNAARGIYVDPALRYEPADFPPQVVADYVAADGELIYRDLRLSYTQSVATAQRLARQFVERSRRAATLRLPCNYNALQVALWQTVRVQIAALGAAHYDAVFRVVSWSLSQEGGVDIGLQLDEASAYAWSAESEKAGQAYTPPTEVDPTDVAPPTNLTVTNDPLTTADGTVVPRLRVQWLPAADAMAAGYELQYKPSADLFYVSGFPLGLVTTSYIAYLDAGTAYDVRLRAVNVRGAHSDWAEELNTTASGDTTAPAAPTLGTVTSGGAGEITAAFTAPLDADTQRVRLYRSPTSGDASPTVMGTVYVLPGQSGSLTETGIAAGTWYVRARALDASGNTSAYSSESSITI